MNLASAAGGSGAIDTRRTDEASPETGAEQVQKRGGRHNRISGIDMARALAVIGMLMVHVGPTGYRGVAGHLYGMPHGRAAILFVLLAGVGTSLLAASRRLTAAHVRLRLAWYAALLLPFGLWLQSSLDHHVLVVLQTYAALFLLGMVAMALPNRWLLGSAATFAALGPLIFLAGRIMAPRTFNRSAVSFDDGWEIVTGIVATGPYPVITWAAPYLLGMWLGRLDLSNDRVQLRLVIGGAAVTALAFALSTGLEAVFGTPVTPVSWNRIIVDHAHSQMPLWLIGATGSACLILGFSLALAELLGRLAWPLIALGQMALTFYAAHLLAFHVAGESLTSNDLALAARISLAMTAVALLAAIGWRSIFRRGPLEMLLHLPWSLARQVRVHAPSSQ